MSPAGQRVGTASFFTCTCCSGPGDELEGQQIGCNVSEAVDASIDKADAALRAPNLFAGARRTSPLARPLLIPCRALNFAAAAITGAAIARPKTQKQRDGRDLRPLPPVTISYDIQEAAENSAAGCGVAVCPLRWRRRRRHRCLRHRRSSPSSIKPLCESPGEAGSHVPGRLMSFIMIGVTCTPALKHCHLPAGWQRFGRVCGRGRGRQVGQCGLCCLHSSSSSAGGRGLLEPGQASLMPRSDTALALAQPLPCLSWLPTVPPPDLRTCPLLPTAAHCCPLLPCAGCSSRCRHSAWRGSWHTVRLQARPCCVRTAERASALRCDAARPPSRRSCSLECACVPLRLTHIPAFPPFFCPASRHLQHAVLHS